MPDIGALKFKLGGDIAFLVKKEFDGKLRRAEGFLSAAGDLATLTATAGKDMYIVKAKCVFFGNTSGVVRSVADEVVLKINTVVVETAKHTVESATVAADTGVLTWEYEFKNIGYKVLATQIIKLEVITLDPDVDIEGFIEVFEEDTGGDPTA